MLLSQWLQLDQPSPKKPCDLDLAVLLHEQRHWHKPLYERLRMRNAHKQATATVIERHCNTQS